MTKFSEQTHSMLNGIFNAPISVMDRGLAYGDGVFTTIAWRNGCIEFVTEHIQRLERDTAALAVQIDKELLANEVVDFINLLEQEKIKEGVIKIILTRQATTRGYFSEKNTPANRLLIWQPLPENIRELQARGINLTVCKQRLSKSNLAGVKHLNRLEQVLARQEWQTKIDSLVVHDGIMLDQNNKIVETTKANIFWRKGNVFYTPMLDISGITGIVRQKVIDILQSMSHRVELGHYDIEQVLEADEIFTTNCLMHVLPVNIVVSEKQYKIASKSFTTLLNEQLGLAIR